MSFTTTGEIRTTTVNVIVSTRNDLLRYGVEQMLKVVDVVGAVRTENDPAEAIAAVVDVTTDFLLVPLAEIDDHSRPILRQAEQRGVRILLLLDDAETAAPGRSGRMAGLHGAGFMIGSDLNTNTLGDTLARMVNGEVPLPPKLAQNLLAMASGGSGEPYRATPRMSPREQQVLVLLVDGLSNKQIARRLKISEHGAKRLVANILAKLDCPNRTRAVTRALKEGLDEQYRLEAYPAS
jgi:DNA-binding NarL/FixJ family response regulator